MILHQCVNSIQTQSRLNSRNDADIWFRVFVIPSGCKNVKIKTYKTIILSVILYEHKTWSLMR
jgi:hypothetical protein